MKPEFRRELAQLPFEEKIRKAGELIRFSRKIKMDGSNDSENAGFNGGELSESVLARDWNSQEEGAARSNR
jgi:hypothetical protein